MTVTESELAQALCDLADTIGHAEFQLTGEQRPEWLALQRRLIDDLGHHAARARDVDAPLLVVLGGVTGAGKSTMANTLSGRTVVATGVIRPTTTQPTLLCHPADVAWFSGPRILTSLSRQVVELDELAGAPSPDGALRIVPLADLDPGLALLDAPDIDSVSTANRNLADLLLDAADLWLWFTTVGKYADEESMRYLARAQRRGTALVVVLTQVRSADRQAVVDDFKIKLAGAGVHPAALAVIPWVERTHTGPRAGGRDESRAGGRDESQVGFPNGDDGMLPPAAVAEVREWLDRLADPAERARQRRQTLEGAVRALSGEMDPIVAATEAELDTARRLLAAVDEAYDDAVTTFSRTIEDGLPLRGEILGRWTDFVGSSRLLELTGRATDQARRMVKDLLRGSGSVSERRLEREVRVEVADTLTDTMTRLADLAATDSLDAWADAPAGRAFAAAHQDLRTPGEDFGDRCRTAVRAWQDAVVELVAERGLERRTRARWMSTAINALATGAIVVALASTGGLTGAEAGIATAAGAVNQALLVSVLGERTVRWLIAESRKDLVRRFGEVLAPERRRLAAAVAAASPDPELPQRVRAAVGRVTS